MPSQPDEPHEPTRKRYQITDDEFEHIRSALRGLQYGTVLIAVQDGVIIQIDRTERRRLRRPREK